jgi:hypothetical protein
MRRYEGQSVLAELSVFVERGTHLFTICERVNFVTAAGYSVHGRADFVRPLSCLPTASSVSVTAPFGWRNKIFFTN